MESHVLGSKSPLYGRRTAQLKLEAFDYLDAAAMVPAVSDPVVLLRYYEEFTLEEIADTLGIAPGTVSARLTRAKRRLRPMLEEWYYD